jgi:hypothetical protein
MRSLSCRGHDLHQLHHCLKQSCFLKLKHFQATKYLLDPLTAPEPNEETGPGSHFTTTVNRAPFASKGPSASASSKSPAVSTYPTPPASASPTRSSFHPTNPYSPSHRQAAFGDYQNAGPSRRSIEEPVGNGKGRRRGSSLGERFPGKKSLESVPLTSGIGLPPISNLLLIWSANLSFQATCLTDPSINCGNRPKQLTAPHT